MIINIGTQLLMIAIGLFQNITIILSLSFIYQFVLFHFQKGTIKFKLISGLLFGIIGVISMMLPMAFTPGIIMDGHLIVLSMAGFIVGPETAIIAALICTVYRIGLGGIGVWTGLGIILSSTFLGIAFFNYSRKQNRTIKLISVWVFGLIVSIVIIAIELLLPYRLGFHLIKDFGIQILVEFPLATLLLFIIIRDFETRFSERKLLVLSEQKFQLASEASQLGIWQWDLLSNIITWDKNCWAMLGYLSDNFPLTYETWIKLLHPLDRESVIDLIENGALKSDTISAECRIQSADKEWVWIEWRGKVIARDLDNTPIRMTGVHLDITERKNILDALSQKEKIFTHSLDLLCISGFNGFFQVINPAWTGTLGWGMEELCTKPWLEFIHPDDQAETNSIITKIIKSEGNNRFENRFLCKDGSIKWLSWNSYPYPDDQILFSVIRDITESKKISESLSKSEEKYRLLFAGMEEGFALHEMIYDDNGNACDYQFLEVNPAFERNTGLSKDILIGHTVLEVMPDTEQYWIETYAQVIHNRTPLKFENYSKVLDKWFNVSAYSPRAGQFATVFSDITEAKKVEVQLKEKNDKLELLFESMPIGISILDNHHNIIKMNQALIDIYGLSRDEIAIGTHRDRKYYRPDGTQKPRNEFAASRISQGEKNIKNVVMGMDKEDGQRLWLEVNGVSCEMDDWHTLLLTADITDRMKMQFENEFYIAKVNQHNRHQEIMLAITLKLREARTRIEAQQIIVDLIILEYGLDAAAIISFDNLNEPTPIHSGNWPLEFLKELLNQLEPLQEKLEAGDPITLFSDTLIEGTTPGHLEMDSTLGVCIAIPILAGKTNIGILLIGNQSNHAINGEVIPMLVAVAEIIGVTLQRMGNVESMKDLISRRTLELSTLYNVISVSEVEKDLSKKLELSMNEVLHALDCHYGAIFFLHENNTHLKMMAGDLGSQEVRDWIESSPIDSLWEGQVIHQAEPVIVPDISINPQFAHMVEQESLTNYILIGVPILIRGEVFGIVSILRQGKKIFNVEEITFINALVNHIGVMIENHQLMDETERNALKEERTRISREMHDSVTQTLYSAVLFANAGLDLVEQSNYQQVQSTMSRLAELTQQALNETRLMIFDMRPPELEFSGLVHAIQKRLEMVEKRISIHPKFSHNQDIRFDMMKEETMYWVAMEALNNICRHSNATEIEVKLVFKPKQIQLSIIDNGIGFNTKKAEDDGGFGIQNIHSRLKKYDGQLDIQSIPGRGTTVSARMPI
jgi:PAS domain S-box-containing protein